MCFKLRLKTHFYRKGKAKTNNRKVRFIYVAVENKTEFQATDG